MQSRFSTIHVGAVAFVLLAPVAAQAVPVPAGLAAGQGYRLAFLTSDRISATSSDISTYNNFVITEAAQNSALDGLGWSAVVSTAQTSASDNVACSGCNDVPIYLVNDSELAASTTALFSTNLMRRFNADQFGFLNNSDYAWTGSTSSGGKKDGATLGSIISSAGYPFSTNSHWIDPNFKNGSGVKLALYALSSEAFVASNNPAAVPEPATLALLGTGGLVAAGVRRRSRRTQA